MSKEEIVLSICVVSAFQEGKFIFDIVIVVFSLVFSNKFGFSSSRHGVVVISKLFQYIFQQHRGTLILTHFITHTHT